MADPRVQSWATPRPYAYALIIGGIALAVGAAVTSGDPAGSILMIIAALLLFSFGGTATFVRPRLRLVQLDGSTTITVSTIFGARTYAQPDVARIRILRFRRMGRRIGHLEFEFDDAARNPATGDGDADDHGDDHDWGDDGDVRIVVLGRWELGVDITEVADALDAAGFHVER